MFKPINHLQIKYFILILHIIKLFLNQNTNMHILNNHIEKMLIHLMSKRNTINYCI